MRTTDGIERERVTTEPVTVPYLCSLTRAVTGANNRHNRNRSMLDHDRKLRNNVYVVRLSASKQQDSDRSR